MAEDGKRLLKADPTDWLLEEENPAVRYLTLRDIVGGSEKEVKAARSKAHREGPIAEILANMNAEGWWVHPGNVYSPKCQGTSWSILALAQMGGAVEEDERIRTACNYLLNVALAQGGQFSNSGEAFKSFSCFQGNMLYSLADLGCRDDRLRKAFEWTARTVSGEGLPKKVTKEGSAESGSGKLVPLSYITGPLFACRVNKGMSCAWAGAKVMLALSRFSEKDRSPLIQRAIDAGVDYFFTNNPASALFPGETAAVPDERWGIFHFPVAGFDLLQVAEALVALGYGGAPRLADTLSLIQSKQNEQGQWLREKNWGYRHTWGVDFGRMNKPNKWVTLRAVRVLKRAAEQVRAT